MEKKTPQDHSFYSPPFKYFSSGWWVCVLHAHNEQSGCVGRTELMGREFNLVRIHLLIAID